MAKISNATKRRARPSTHDDPDEVKRDAPENDTDATPDGTDTRDATADEGTLGESVAAYLARKGAWASLGDDELVVPRANVGYVVQRVMQLADALQTPEVLAAYAALEKVPLLGGERYDASCLTVVPVTARALWHVRAQLLSASARAVTVALPQKLVDEAGGLRATMLKVVEYVCVDERDDDDPVAEDLASIRKVEGPKYIDLATDLTRLAAYYRDPVWQPRLAAEGVRYRPEDGARAATLSHEILQKLRQGDDTAATWTVELQRGWTELGRMWATLRRGGAFVFHGRLDAKLPLLGALRPTRARCGATNDADDPAPTPARPA